jgi:hypothetical protein
MNAQMVLKSFGRYAGDMAEWLQLRVAGVFWVRRVRIGPDGMKLES